MTDWQPIETAPRDKTKVLLWRPQRAQPEKGWMEVGYWHQPANPDYPGMWSCSGIPTHWMPLPEPPGPTNKGDL